MERIATIDTKAQLIHVSTDTRPDTVIIDDVGAASRIVFTLDMWRKINAAIEVATGE